MGQKVNPNSFRLQITKDWRSKWFSNGKDYAQKLHEDIKIRDFILDNYGVKSGISRVDIKRDADTLDVIIHSSRPGVLIGRGGAGINEIKKKISRFTESKIKDITIEEIRTPELDAKIMADSIKEQLEKRIAFKRAAKQALEKIMRAGAEGAKINISGRLNGVEIARSQAFSKGKIPMSTLRADIDYGFSEAWTTYGILGIKVWIYRGERKQEEKENVNA